MLTATRTLAFCAALLPGAAVLAQGSRSAPYALLDPMPLPSLSGAVTGLDWHPATAIDLGDRQQLRLAPAPLGYHLPTSGLYYDPARATYRYTVLERDSWAWRVGLTANLNPVSGLAPPLWGETTRFGSLPMLHMAGEARIAQRWQLGVDADGLMTARGRALELGLQVSYQMARNFSLFGGYRLSGSTGDAEEYYGSGVSNAANVGLRLRF